MDRRILAAVSGVTIAGLAAFAPAAPYASGVTEAGGNVTFILNEASSNVVVIRDGVPTSLGPLGVGSHTFARSGATNYSIQVQNNSTCAPRDRCSFWLRWQSRIPTFFLSTPLAPSHASMSAHDPPRQRISRFFKNYENSAPDESMLRCCDSSSSEISTSSEKYLILAWKSQNKDGTWQPKSFAIS